MLTDRTIKALKPPASGQVDVTDGADVKGLILRVSQRSKTFYLSFRNPNGGKPAKIRIGEYPEIGLASARETGRAYRALVEKGVDPRQHEKAEAERRALEAEEARAEAERKATNTLARAVTDSVDHCQKAGQRRWRDRERQLRRYVPTGWLTRQLEEISRTDCKDLLGRLETENDEALRPIRHHEEDPPFSNFGNFSRARPQNLKTNGVVAVGEGASAVDPVRRPCRDPDARGRRVRDRPQPRQ